MKNFNSFSKALSERFEIPIEIFDLHKPDSDSTDNKDDFFVSEPLDMPENPTIEFYQYINRYDEGWGCVRLYIDKTHIKDVLDFILKYHKNLFSEEELQPVRTTLETGKGHFAMPDETESLSYLEGVFDEEQAFIEVARVMG
jgi:hypothetical protein